jgi:hypothetical protein
LDASIVAHFGHVMPTGVPLKLRPAIEPDMQRRVGRRRTALPIVQVGCAPYLGREALSQTWLVTRSIRAASISSNSASGWNSSFIFLQARPEILENAFASAPPLVGSSRYINLFGSGYARLGYSKVPLSTLPSLQGLKIGQGRGKCDLCWPERLKERGLDVGNLIDFGN